MLMAISELLQSGAIILLIIDVYKRFKKLEEDLKELGIDIKAYDKLKQQQAQQNKNAEKIKKVGKWK